MLRRTLDEYYTCGRGEDQARISIKSVCPYITKARTGERVSKPCAQCAESWRKRSCSKERCAGWIEESEHPVGSLAEVINRTAVYVVHMSGGVEGRGREASPYPDYVSAE